MILLSMIVPAVLAWFLANIFAREKNEAQRDKIKQLQTELKKCYEEKQIIKTKLVTPTVKFSDSNKGTTGARKKSGGSKGKSAKTGSQNTSKTNTVKESRKQVSGNAKSKYPKLQDNLEVVEGIGPKMKEILLSNGIETWNALAALSPKQIKEILNKYGDRYRIIDPKSWPLQAKLAEQNEWAKLISAQESEGKSTAKVTKQLIKYGYVKKYKQDDLKAIEGIGPKIAGLLNEAGINTWYQLANTQPNKIKEILAKAGKRYALAKPDSWPSQAKLAAEGNFSGLEQLQSKLKGGA